MERRGPGAHGEIGGDGINACGSEEIAVSVVWGKDGAKVPGVALRRNGRRLDSHLGEIGTAVSHEVRG